MTDPEFPSRDPGVFTRPGSASIRPSAITDAVYELAVRVGDLEGTAGVPGPPGPAGPEGEEGLNSLGPWSPLVSYQIDDLVTRAGSSWLAVQPSLGVDPALDKSRNVVGSLTATSGLALGSPQSVAATFTVDQAMTVLALNALGSFTGPPYDGEVGLASAINVPGVGVQWLGKGDPDASGIVTFPAPVHLTAGVEYWYVLKLSQANIFIDQPGDLVGSHVAFAGDFWYGSAGEPSIDFGGAYGLAFTLYGSTGGDPWTVFAAQGTSGPPGANGAPGAAGPAGANGTNGAPGPAGAVAVAAQPAPPTSQLGALWIDTDELAIYGPKWVQLTQAAYDALSPPDPNTLYLVVG